MLLLCTIKKTSKATAYWMCRVTNNLLTLSIQETIIMLPFIGANAENTGASYFGHIFGANNYSENGIVVPSTLKSVYVTGGTSIGANAFRECRYIREVSLPSSITKIDSYAFYRCNLTSIVLPTNLEKIESWAFSECYGLTSVTIGKGLTSIGDNAFSSCDKLTSVYIKNLAAWCTLYLKVRRDG